MDAAMGTRRPPVDRRFFHSWNKEFPSNRLISATE